MACLGQGASRAAPAAGTRKPPGSGCGSWQLPSAAAALLAHAAAANPLCGVDVQAWGLPPYRLLMVGDSTEDVETGNAAGTATCLIAGGGNEVVAPPPSPAAAAYGPAAAQPSSDSSSSSAGGPFGAAAPPPAAAAAPAAAAPAPAMPPGAVPTFSVDSLGELLRRLQACDTALGWGGRGGAAFEAAASGGAPPPGLGFLDFLFISGVVAGAHCSFPRVAAGSARSRPADTHPGDRVLHFGCGDAALTKLLASSGLQVQRAGEGVAGKGGVCVCVLLRVGSEGRPPGRRLQAWPPAACGAARRGSGVWAMSGLQHSLLLGWCSSSAM